MFKDYSIKDKINFLKKIQDDVKFKQATFAKSLPDNFIFLNKSPFKGGLENFLENLNDESIEELAQSESGRRCFR